VPRRPALDFYAQHAALTSAGRHAAWLEGLPSDVAGLCRVVQGLVVHEFMAGAYGLAIPEPRRMESHLRPVEEMLERLLGLDSAPLGVPRPADRRLIGVSRHFAVLLVAMLRAQGVPARVRCGFGAYFNPPLFEEHYVCEYWNPDGGRWVLVDPQFDDVWVTQLGIRHDVLDLPRDRFLVAADAWVACRSGRAEPGKFGIFVGDLRGLWFVAAELVRDLAALNRTEMLPWDDWGAMPLPDWPLDAEELAFFDRLARVTHAPDATFGALRRLYEDDSVRVTDYVFNAVLNRPEEIVLQPSAVSHQPSAAEVRSEV
jgi:hypothetical protein